MKIKPQIITSIIFVLFFMHDFLAFENDKPLKINGVYGIRVKGFWFCKVKIRKNNTYTLRSIQFNCKTNQGPNRTKGNYSFDSINKLIILHSKNSGFDSLYVLSRDSINIEKSGSTFHRLKLHERL